MFSSAKAALSTGSGIEMNVADLIGLEHQAKRVVDRIDGRKLLMYWMDFGAVMFHQLKHNWSKCGEGRFDFTSNHAALRSPSSHHNHTIYPPFYFHPLAKVREANLTFTFDLLCAFSRCLKDVISPRTCCVDCAASYDHAL